MNWLRVENRRPRRAEEEAPVALAIVDRKAMTMLHRDLSRLGGVSMST